jgi:hypothetical protein
MHLMYFSNRHEAQYDLFLNLIAIEVGTLRATPAVFDSAIGVLFAIDAIGFEGQYRRAVWREAEYQGQLFDREVEYMLRKSLW